MRLGIILSMLLFAGNAMAFCPFSDTLRNSLQDKSIMMLYVNCAETFNDDGAQAYLASVYDKGTTKAGKNITKALYYYQLSADNGNAESQSRLAQLYMELDKDREGRAELKKYLNSVVSVDKFTIDLGQQQVVRTEDGFKGELMHPYVLLMLANEKEDNKWYYPTEVKKAPTYAVTLFRNFQVDENRKKEFTRQATAWKKRKLLEMARQVLPSNEYKNFVAVLYPSKGTGDSFKRNQLLKDLREKINQKKQQEKARAEALY